MQPLVLQLLVLYALLMQQSTAHPDEYRYPSSDITTQHISGYTASEQPGFRSLQAFGLMSGGVERPRPCHAQCTVLGNCNAEEGRCECPYGRQGPFCEQETLSACATIPGGQPSCGVAYPKSCQCYSQCWSLYCRNSLLIGDCAHMTSRKLDRAACFVAVADDARAGRTAGLQPLPLARQLSDIPLGGVPRNLSSIPTAAGLTNRLDPDPGSSNAQSNVSSNVMFIWQPHAVTFLRPASERAGSKLPKPVKRRITAANRSVAVPLSRCTDRCHDRGYCVIPGPPAAPRSKAAAAGPTPTPQSQADVARAVAGAVAKPETGAKEAVQDAGAGESTEAAPEDVAADSGARDAKGAAQVGGVQQRRRALNRERLRGSSSGGSGSGGSAIFQQSRYAWIESSGFGAGLRAHDNSSSSGSSMSSGVGRSTLDDGSSGSGGHSGGSSKRNSSGSGTGTVQPMCRCKLGWRGAFCEEADETACWFAPSCNGHGICKAGFCHCEPGWFGLGCTRSKAFQPPQAALDAGGRTLHLFDGAKVASSDGVGSSSQWNLEQGADSGSGGGGGGNGDIMGSGAEPAERDVGTADGIDISDVVSTFQGHAGPGGDVRSGSVGSYGVDSLRTESGGLGSVGSVGIDGGNGPRDVVHEGSSSARRMLREDSSDGMANSNAASSMRIYMYELPWQVAFPGELNDGTTARHEIYIAYESFLQHFLQDWDVRTEDPWAADLFYVPMLSFFYSGNVGSPAVQMQRVLQHVAQTAPFWNRSGGADHFYWVPLDRGICHLPWSLRSAAIKIVHFGLNNSSAPGWEVLLKRNPEGCYDRRRDVVAAPYYGSVRTAREAHAVYERIRRSAGHDPDRKLLFFFAGAVKRDSPFYSGGARQAVQAMLQQQSYDDVVYIEGAVGKRYGEFHATSKFCLAPYGGGYGMRLTTAMMAGCVPVIIQDYVEQPYEEQLPYSSFSLRLSVADVPSLVTTLRNFSDDALARMRLAMAEHYRAFLWQDGPQDTGGTAYNHTIQALAHRLQLLRTSQI